MGKKIKNAIVAASAFDPKNLWKFLKNKEVPLWKKSLMFIALAWVISLADGDWIPLLGWLDDFGIVSLATWLTRKWIQDMLDLEAKRLDTAHPESPST